MKSLTKGYGREKRLETSALGETNLTNSGNKIGMVEIQDKDQMMLIEHSMYQEVTKGRDYES